MCLGPGSVCLRYLSRSQTKPMVFPIPLFIPLWYFLSLPISRLQASALSPQSFPGLETLMPPELPKLLD